MKYILIILFAFTVNAQNVWYVNRDATGLGNGTSWTNAWNFLDNNGYYDRETGVDWSSISSGDTIYISGGSDSTVYRPHNGYGEWISNANPSGTVVIAPAWHSGHNGDVYFMNSDTLVVIPPFTSSEVGNNFYVVNSSNLKFVNLNFVVNEPRPSYSGTRSVNVNLEDDSLITFENCHIITNGIAGNIGMTNCAMITFENNLIENEYNTFTEDNDLFTWSQAGYGQHTIRNNEIVNRNAYIGTSGDGTGMTATSTSMTVFGASWMSNLHKHADVIAGSSTMIIMSNDANTLYGTWDVQPSNGTAWTIASSAHRDVMQMGYGYNPSRPTTKFINNFIWVLYQQDVNSWNQMHYLGANAEDQSIQNFVYINNLFVTPIDTNGNGIAVIAQNWDNAVCKSKWEFYNNTFITTGGWIGNTQAMDSCIAYNNIFVTLNPNSSIRLARSDEVSVDSIDYNYWSVPNWNTRTWPEDATFLWDNYNYWDWDEWQAAGNDVHSLRDVNGTIDLQSVQDSVISAYYTTAGRDAGRNLSYLSTKYPEIMYDILGNERGYGGTWDIGALEYQGTVGTPTKVRMRQIIIQ